MKGVREHRDVEKQEVARAIGVSSSTYIRWEDGLVPGDGAMEKLAGFFGVTPAYLRYGTLPREYPQNESAPELDPNPQPMTDREAEALEKRLRGTPAVKKRKGNGR